MSLYPGTEDLLSTFLLLPKVDEKRLLERLRLDKFHASTIQHINNKLGVTQQRQTGKWILRQTVGGAREGEHHLPEYSAVQCLPLLHFEHLLMLPEVNIL